MASQEAESFLIELGKTLGRANLYSMNHPAVKESLQACFAQLTNLLSAEPELAVGLVEDKILLNAAPLANPAAQGAMLGLLQKFHLNSVTFKPGVRFEELISFFKLLTGRQEMKSVEEIKSFLETENVKSIQLDVAVFAKVGSKQKVSDVAAGAGAGTGAGSANEAASELIRSIQDLTLENMIMEVIRKAVPDPEDQKKIFEIIFKQIQSELDTKVEKATRQLRQEKEQVTTEKERTESVINNIAEGIIVVDDEGKIVMMNPAAEKIYGATFTQMKGKRLIDQTREELMITLAKDVGPNPNRDAAKQVSVQSPEQTQQVIKSSTAAIKTPDGKIVGIMSILNDIAKQKELQRMQNDFIAHVTHELRSPLTAIKASIGTMADDTGTGPQQRQILNIANRNVDRLSRLINDLLDTTRIESGKMSVNPKAVDPTALVQDAVSSLQSWSKAKQIELSCAVQQGLPEISADYDRAMQVLVNLISNAIKFTPFNGTIKIAVESSGSLYIKFSVSDSGPGISQEDQKRLFERFSQLKQTERSDTPGTGLGLYISKSIVELHNGEIGLHSEPGRGTTFYFTLPKIQQIAKPPAAIGGMGGTVQLKKTEKKGGWLSRLFGK